MTFEQTVKLIKHYGYTYRYSEDKKTIKVLYFYGFERDDLLSLWDGETNEWEDVPKYRHVAITID